MDETSDLDTYAPAFYENRGAKKFIISVLETLENEAIEEIRATSGSSKDLSLIHAVDRIRQSLYAIAAGKGFNLD